MLTRPHRAAVSLVFALWLGPVVAPGSGPAMRAAHADASSAELLAKQSYARGAELYKAHKFAEAAAAFNEGYSHKPHYAFLWNLALAYRGMGDHEKAIASYRRYLKDCPPAATADRAAAEAAIAEEQRALAAPTAVAAAAPPAAAAAPVLGHASEGKPAERKVWQKWWFWTATGAALAAVGVGLGVGLSSSGSTAPYREVTWQ